MRNLSYENEFCVASHFHANQSHFHKNSFALGLALRQRHKGTRNWPIFQLPSIQYTTSIHFIGIIDVDLIASDDTVFLTYS